MSHGRFFGFACTKRRHKSKLCGWGKKMLILEVKWEEHWRKVWKHKKQPPNVYCVKTQNKDNFFSLWALATLAGASIFSSQASQVPTFSNWPFFFNHFFFRKLLRHMKKLCVQLRVINRTWDVLWRGQTERGHPWGQRSSSRLQSANITRNYSTPPLTALPPWAERRSYLSK